MILFLFFSFLCWLMVQLLYCVFLFPFFPSAYFLMASITHLTVWRGGEAPFVLPLLRFLAFFFWHVKDFWRVFKGTTWALNLILILKHLIITLAWHLETIQFRNGFNEQVSTHFSCQVNKTVYASCGEITPKEPQIKINLFFGYDVTLWSEKLLFFH